MIVTVLGGDVPVTLRLPINPTLLSRKQTRKCETAGLRCGVYKALVNGQFGRAEFYYKPNFGQCYAIEVEEKAMCTVYERLKDCVAIVNGHDINPGMMSALERSNPDMCMAIHNMYWDARLCVLNTCDSAQLDATILPNNRLLITGEAYIEGGRFNVCWHDTLYMHLDLAAQKPQPVYAGIMYPDDGADGEILREVYSTEIDVMLRYAGLEMKKFLEKEFIDNSYDTAQVMEALYV